jgi:hypothetical protein
VRERLERSDDAAGNAARFRWLARRLSGSASSRKYKLWAARAAARCAALFGSEHIAWLIAIITILWLVFVVTFSIKSFYGPPEFMFFRRASIWQVFSVMEYGNTYNRFSPLGFGPIVGSTLMSLFRFWVSPTCRICNWPQQDD